MDQSTAANKVPDLDVGDVVRSKVEGKEPLVGAAVGLPTARAIGKQCIRSRRGWPECLAGDCEAQRDFEKRTAPDAGNGAERP
jgi:hypothetical protein